MFRHSRRQVLGDAIVLGAMLGTADLLGACGETKGEGGTGGGGTGGTGTTLTGDYVPPNDSDDWETADPEANGWSPSGLDDLLAVVEANHSSSFMTCSL